MIATALGLAAARRLTCGGNMWLGALGQLGFGGAEQKAVLPVALEKCDASKHSEIAWVSSRLR
jgi:hypothetical protein